MFVLRIEDDVDFVVGATFETLAEIGRVARSIPEADEANYFEFLSIVNTNEEKQTKEWAARLIEQAEKLKQLAGDSWLLDRLSELKADVAGLDAA